MLLDKYSPKKINDIVGQKVIIKRIRDWLKRWKPGKALLLYGPTGVGKTLIASVIANEKNMRLLEINASDKRTASSIKKILEPATKDNSLSKNRLILIDEIDGLSGADRGGASEIKRMIKESKFPIILIANNAYNPKLRVLRSYCELLKLKRIPVNLIEKRLRDICKKEKLKIDDDTIRKIAINSNGDIRSAINDLETASIGYREREKNIFDVLRTIFKGKDLKTVLKSIDQCDKDIDEIIWWVEQNIYTEFKETGEIAKAFDILSKADLFRSKIIISRNYRFKGYMKNLIAGIALVRKKPYYRFNLYRPPDRLVILGRTKMIRYRMDEIYKDLGNFLHCSKRKVKKQLPYLKIILKEHFK